MICTKIDMILEAVVGRWSVKNVAYRKFSKFWVEPTCWVTRDSSRGVFFWISQNFQDHLFWITSANGYVCEMKQCLLWNSQKCLHGKKTVMVSFAVHFLTWGLTVFLKWATFQVHSYKIDHVFRSFSFTGHYWLITSDFSPNELSWNSRNIFLQVVHSTYSENI